MSPTERLAIIARLPRRRSGTEGVCPEHPAAAVVWETPAPPIQLGFGAIGNPLPAPDAARRRVPHCGAEDCGRRLLGRPKVCAGLHREVSWECDTAGLAGRPC
jgi:hypothetical protein